MNYVKALDRNFSDEELEALRNIIKPEPGDDDYVEPEESELVQLRNDNMRLHRQLNELCELICGPMYGFQKRIILLREKVKGFKHVNGESNG